MKLSRRLVAILSVIPLIVVGSRITLPGVNASALADFTRATGRGGLLGLYELVFQGGLYRGAVLGLGIMPYLTARLYLRLWRAVNPKAEASPQKARVLTFALSLIQSFGVATFLQRAPGVVAEPGAGFITKTVLTLTAGSLVAMWFGEQLTEPIEPEVDDTISALPERLEASPILIGPATPASPPTHPRPSIDAETLRTPR
jgi:preprotein translocase subunit SecY